MPRVPLVNEPKLARNEFARSEKYNDLFRRCLRSDILPGRDTHFRRFRHDEVFAGQYLDARQWEDDRIFLAEDASFRHEKWLDSVFWKPLDNPRICIVGSLGSGKSTLVDYYLRCFCPNAGDKKEDFAKKLVLHFDARGVRDNHESYQYFYGRCQSLIRTACTLGSPSFDIDVALRRAHLPSENVARWVQYALEEISSGRTHFEYVVVVLDNLDNSPIEVQRRLIRDVEFWLTLPSIKIWRVFLPLWPTTLTGLQRSDLSLLRGATEFRLGTVSEFDLLDNRINALKFGVPISVDDGDQDAEFRHYLDTMLPLIRRRLGIKLRNLTYGDLRSELYLWDGILTSQVAFTIWKDIQDNPQHARPFEYDFVSALVSGPYEQHHKNNVVRNIFRLGHNNLSPRDLLVAYHGMALLGNGNGNVNSWYRGMGQLGYSWDNLQVVEENYREMNVFHQTPDAKPYGPDSYDFHLHEEVVAGYLDLVTTPAYVDSISQTTPVEDKWRSRMKATRADRLTEFTPRVETSITFLEFMNENEAAFKTLVQAEDRAFAKSCGLPSFAFLSAQRYRERLLALQTSTASPVSRGSSWWREQISRLDNICKTTSETLDFTS